MGRQPDGPDYGNIFDRPNGPGGYGYAFAFLPQVEKHIRPRCLVVGEYLISCFRRVNDCGLLD